MERAAEGKRIFHVPAMAGGRVEGKYRQYKNADIELRSNGLQNNSVSIQGRFLSKSHKRYS